MIDGRTRLLTPFEAAVVEDRPEIVALLLHSGAALEPETWTSLHCLAEHSESGDTQAFLETVRPAAAAAACEGVPMPPEPR